MTPTDSMFLFEIIVEELTSFVNCSEFCIRGQFADVFSVHLKDPNEHEWFLPKGPGRQKSKRKIKTKNGKGPDRPSTAATVQTGQTILFAINIDTLISNMKQYPLELSLWSKVVPDYKVGSTHIPWTAPYYEYLNKLHRRHGPQPICVRGNYNVFDEATSKRMAVIKLNVKLRHFKDKITTQFRFISQETQQTVVNTGLNSEPVSVLGKMIKDRPINLSEETGTIKTICDEKRKPSPTKKKNIKKKETESIEDLSSKERVTEVESAEVDRKINNRRLNSRIITLARSDRNISKNSTLAVIKSKSCSSIVQRNTNILNNYIFGDKSAGPFGNQVYCVSYFTVNHDFADSPSAQSASPKSASPSSPTPKSPKSEKSVKAASENSKSEKSDELQEKERYKIRICKSECVNIKKNAGVPGIQSSCSLDLPQKASHFITVKKCNNIKCGFEKQRELPTPPDDLILLDLSTRRADCCDLSEKVEQVIAGMKAKMKFGTEPCYCECECQFGFMKKTTYCEICGGFERFGEDFAKKPGYELPFPCPIFHKLAEKNKLKVTASGSDTKKRESDKKEKVESEKEVTKKGKKKKIDSRFKFNYGYTAPHIGHSRCALPCVGNLNVVPKRMGWLWSCENVPGMKFRPLWKPGATNKHVVRLLKMAKNPGEFLAKKRKKIPGKPKRALKRPLLTVQKKDGEYTVTMETMRTFLKPRTFNQYPYEDKPLVTYTIGRTSEENLQRKLKKERAQRRLERLQRDFVQSAFRDMCKEICIKTYQQALGILPDAEQPDCSCYPAQPGPDDVDLDHSCSCSEDKDLSESDTDSDEWIVEFTPPTATYDPTFKTKKLLTTDTTTQYAFTDYKVKLLDRLGNPVPRFFKGPDGKQQCSDLGGFWDPNHKWLEINVDGFIGPDEKWVPHIFLGPNGEPVDGEPGKFQAADGKWLVIGVDGYVDQGKWKFYPKSKSPVPKKRRSWKKHPRDTKEDKRSEATWSCFGSVSPKQLSKMGIVGHGHDKKVLYSKLKDMLAQGEDVKIPKPTTVPRSHRPKGKLATARKRTFVERTQCKHATPSDKGIVAVDGHGNKTYFKFKDFVNTRPKDRMTSLTDKGISVSSFHVPCFHSFISSEMMKKQQYDRLVALAERRAALAPGARQNQFQVAQGWKPGAISNRLLKKLNKAKQQTQPEQRVKPTKKPNKKTVEDKPTLIICKRNGEYRVEMQVSPEDSDVNVDQQQCSPLVYRISREDNEDRIKKRLRKRRRIVKEAVDKVWVDPYHPEICEKTCLRAYREAIGLSNPNNPECTCSEEDEEEDECSCCNGEEDDDDSSDCSSLDLEWEIHFSPPIAAQD